MNGLNVLKRTVAVCLVGFVVMTTPISAGAYSGFGMKESMVKDEIASGVSLIREQYKSGSVARAVQVLDVSYRNPAVSLELYHPSPLGTVQTTSRQALENTRAGHYVVGAVNASFYNLANGFPVNLLVKKNEILHYGILSADANGPVNAPFAFGVNRNGALTITDYEPALHFTHNGKSFSLASVNGDRQDRKAVLYTEGYAKATTGASQYATELVVTETNKSAKQFSFGDRIVGTVSEVRKFGEGANAPIPKDGFVISANGGPFLNHWRVQQLVMRS